MTMPSRLPLVDDGGGGGLLDNTFENGYRCSIMCKSENIVCTKITRVITFVFFSSTDYVHM